METALKIIGEYKIPEKSYTVTTGDRLSSSGKAVYFDKRLKEYIPRNCLERLARFGYEVKF